jgi:hypothetical protein
MKIVLQDITPPIASLAEGFKKIIFSNGTHFYPHDLPQDEYQELALHALEENNGKNNKWKIISNTTSGKFSPHKKQILQHVTRSRNILCTTSDARSVLHHSSYILNEHFEIVPITSELRAQLLKEINQYASEGNSVSGIGIKRIESSSSDTRNIHNGIFIAMVLHEYILSPDVSTTIDKMKNSNASIKIFSNELLSTCKSIARKIGINASNDLCITSDQLQSLPDSELASHLSHTTIFAEMKALDRERVSRLLEEQGHEIYTEEN